MDSAEKTASTIDEQIEFAWHNFEDQQAIIRAADLKAGYLVPFLLFFGASTIPLGTEVESQWPAFPPLTEPTPQRRPGSAP